MARPAELKCENRIEKRCTCGFCFVERGGRWLIRAGHHYADQYCPRCGCRLDKNGFAYPPVRTAEQAKVEFAFNLARDPESMTAAIWDIVEHGFTALDYNSRTGERYTGAEIQAIGEGREKLHWECVDLAKIVADYVAKLEKEIVARERVRQEAYTKISTMRNMWQGLPDWRWNQFSEIMQLLDRLAGEEIAAEEATDGT